MLEAQPAVALLFDDAELGGHLRQVLQDEQWREPRFNRRQTVT